MSHAASSFKEAKQFAKDIGLPVMVRAAYALGGESSGIAFNEKEFDSIAQRAFSFSPQILVEKYLHHYKEIEYEVVRDQYDNCITVCNMENFDPLGIHTGESIVVAPSQTLTNHEYHYLRDASIRLVRSMGIVGECNVQFAVAPQPRQKGTESEPVVDYEIIEMNARLSRSSALASKATGYPLAYVAAKLALGKSLVEIENHVNRRTTSFFEPALDYVVTKIPRWDLEKFKGVEEKIGTAMKSVGEVMGIGRTFEESLQKALRMLDIGVEGATDEKFETHKEAQGEKKESRKQLKDITLKQLTPTPKRIFHVSSALRNGLSVEEIYQHTGIDPWFLHRIAEIVHTEKQIQDLGYKGLSSYQAESKIGILRHAKQRGISDKRIGKLTGKSMDDIRTLRKEQDILPSVFRIDTLGGEFPAQTNYLYMTYNGNHHDVSPVKKNGIMVLGSGPYRIGSSVEFDWTCVHTAMALKGYKKQSIIVNCNPETVSTDYDISDRLYFDELTAERVLDIADFEQSEGVIVSVGGQTPNNLSQVLHAHKVPLLGTQAKDIDRAEDRSKFSALLDKRSIPQPHWDRFTTLEGALDFADKVGYPVMIRPSYVLSGAAMSISYSEKDLKTFIKKVTDIDSEHPVTISKFMDGAREIEFDAVAKDGSIIVSAMSEHIENAGVHSGDSSMVFPTQRIYASTERKIRDIATKLSHELNITGPMNIQFLAKDTDVYVIEMNVRASRTFPLISKALNINFADAVVDAIMRTQHKLPDGVLTPVPKDYVVVKAPQFSFSRLTGADPVLQVEMASTGEVACFGKDLYEAYYKSILATGVSIKSKSALLSLGGMVNKERFLTSARMLAEMGYKLYATDQTHSFLKSRNVKSHLVPKVHEEKRKSVIDVIESGDVSLVINLSKKVDKEEIKLLHEHVIDGYKIRRATVDANIPLFTDLHGAIAFVRALNTYAIDDLEVKSLGEYHS
jgi:carbamoyl-phosphate synthase large subunit